MRKCQLGIISSSLRRLPQACLGKVELQKSEWQSLLGYPSWGVDLSSRWGVNLLLQGETLNQTTGTKPLLLEDKPLKQL